MVTFVAGDDETLGLTFPAGTDLTGCKVYVTVKPEDKVDTPDATDSLAVFKGDATGWVGQTNRTVVTVSPVGDRPTPGDHYFDIQVKDSGGNIKTWGKPQRCLVVSDVTQRTD